MGLGIVHTKLGKQKLNNKSSKEAEVVGTSEYFPYNIWLLMSLLEQGYNMVNITLYQDNQSTTKIERNGRNSCSGHSTHINIRYFFVKDIVNNVEVKIEYCTTHEILADFFTKPLYGGLFHNSRDVIMGYKHITKLLNGEVSIEERVEDQKL